MPRTGRPKKSRDIECVCGNCGMEYTVPEWQPYGRKYCSKDCSDAARVGQYYGAPAEVLAKTCPECDTTFETGGVGRPKRYQKYCSRLCANTARGFHPEPRTMLREDAFWLAGLFDGEGNLHFTLKKYPLRAERVKIAIYNTHKPLLDLVQQITGTGRITTQDRGNPKHAISHTWQCYGANACNLLEQMMPRLIVKRDKARIALGLEPDG